MRSRPSSRILTRHRTPIQQPGSRERAIPADDDNKTTWQKRRNTQQHPFFRQRLGERDASMGWMDEGNWNTKGNGWCGCGRSRLFLGSAALIPVGTFLNFFGKFEEGAAARVTMPGPPHEPEPNLPVDATRDAQTRLALTRCRDGYMASRIAPRRTAWLGTSQSPLRGRIRCCCRLHSAKLTRRGRGMHFKSLQSRNVGWTGGLDSLLSRFSSQAIAAHEHEHQTDSGPCAIPSGLRCGSDVR